MDEKIKTFLRNEIYFHGGSQDDLDFRIQYTCFERNEPDSNVWYMNSTIFSTENEALYSIEVESSDSTFIQFISDDNHYRNFTFTGFQDNRNKSHNTCIYACDLFPDFEPHHFNGICTTKGNITEWNVIKIPKDNEDEDK